MKKTILILSAISLLAASCHKDDAQKEVVLNLQDDSIDMTVQTKASAVNSLPGTLNLARTKGTAGSSETNENASASKTVSSNKINTGWYQTATPTAYNYYLSNSAIAFAAGGSTIAASNTTDIIAGVVKGSTSTAPSVTMGHIFARTGTFTCNTVSGYDISGVSWKIQSKSGGTGGTAGTYNMATGAWSGVTALAQQAVNNSSDLYLTPGVYTITVTYTLAKGAWSKQSTRSGDVTLVAGKVNNISCSALAADATATEIVLSVSLTGWSGQDVPLTLS